MRSKEIRSGLPEYAVRRLVAIEATQVLLYKHLDQVAAIDTKLGLLYAERATMQIRCQIEHQRLIQLFMEDKKARSAKVSVQTHDHTVDGRSPQCSRRPTYQELCRQLAVAPPGEQKKLC